MKIPAPLFFKFCAGHVPLLRALADHQGELSEAGAREIIRATGEVNDERPEVIWQRLLFFQILLQAEAEGDSYIMAPPVSRLIAYLFDDAKAATPEIIQGYIKSTETLNARFSRAIDEDSVAAMRLSLEELQVTLQRILEDVDETYRSIATEVANYKSQRRNASMQERFRRIVHWMERYINPMVELVRPDGPMRATLDETESLVRRARAQSMFNDLPLLELSTRRIRYVARKTFHVFQQCRQELRPLYDSLRRSSFMAEGAALALARLQRDGLRLGWDKAHTVLVRTMNMRSTPSDSAIKRCLRNLIEYTPTPPPVVQLGGDEKIPDDLVRQQWLLGLPDELHGELPVHDLLLWITARYPSKVTADVLDAFTHIVYSSRFSVRFTDSDEVEYPTADGALTASPTELRNA